MEALRALREGRYTNPAHIKMPSLVTNLKIRIGVESQLMIIILNCKGSIYGRRILMENFDLIVININYIRYDEGTFI
jgi:hypothetical protein